MSVNQIAFYLTLENCSTASVFHKVSSHYFSVALESSLPIKFCLIHSLDDNSAVERMTHDLPAKLKVTYKPEQFRNPARANIG